MQSLFVPERVIVLSTNYKHDSVPQNRDLPDKKLLG